MANSFNKVYFKWVGDLADMGISILFFTTICLNLWEERELQNYSFDNELNDSNNREKSGNQNTDEFKKSNNNIDEKQNKNKDNLPNNEEVKVKNSLNYPEKI